MLPILLAAVATASQIVTAGAAIAPPAADSNIVTEGPTLDRCPEMMGMFPGFPDSQIPDLFNEPGCKDYPIDRMPSEPAGNQPRLRLEYPVSSLNAPDVAIVPPGSALVVAYEPTGPMVIGYIDKAGFHSILFADLSPVASAAVEAEIKREGK